MWYTRNKIILADVYDTLASMPLQWAGNFNNTFGEFNVYDSRPDPDALPDFIKQYVVPLLYKYEKRGDDDKVATTRDIDALIYFCSNFIDYYLRQEKIPRATYVLIETLSLASKVNVKLGGSPHYISGESWKTGDSSYAQNILNLDYGYLKAVAQAGLNFSSPFLYYVISGNDIKDNPLRVGKARDEFVKYFLNSHPFTQYYLPESHVELQKLLQNPTFTTDRTLIKRLRDSGRDVSKGWMIRNAVKTLLVEAPSHSGAESDEVFPFLESYIKNPESDNVNLGYDSIGPYKGDEFVNLLQKINDKKIAITPDNIIKFVDAFRVKFDELDVEQVTSIRDMPNIIGIINGNKNAIYNSERIEAGLGEVDETVEYLKASPEKIKKMTYVTFLPDEIINDCYEKVNEQSKLISSNTVEAYKHAIKSGKIERRVASQDSSIMDFLLNEGTKNMGLTEEEIQGYANHLTVYRFNSWEIKNLFKESGSTTVNGINFSGDWSGLFVPRFLDPEDNTKKPAIFIKKDASNTHEYLRGLSDNLKLSLSTFSDATTKHEGAHALHYVGVGDAMMASPVLEQEKERRQRKLELEQMSPEERLSVPGRVWESDEILYLTDPAEIYARAHGDIPHLLDVFKKKIEELKDNPLVAQAIENQWVDDVVGTVAGLASGGTSAARLQQDLANSNGWLSKNDNPIEAINKILSRQEAKLRSAYRENILEEQRTATLQILKQIKDKQFEFSQATKSGTPTIKIEQQLRDLNKELSLVRTRRVFNVDGIADLILAGYLRDYMMRITDAVGAGHITTDRILSPETQDEIKNRENELKKRPAEDRVVPPTSMDIRDLGEDIVKQSAPIPGGRAFDFLIKVPAPMHARDGFFPHLPAPEEPPVTASFRWYGKRRSYK